MARARRSTSRARLQGWGARVAPLLLAAACGTADATDGGVTSCRVSETPSFELGTGETAFAPLADEQELALARGPQGGCHFWLAARTDGFAQRRFELRYQLTDLDAGREIIRSRASQNLKLRPDAPGLCELFGFTAFVLEPWRFEGHRVRIEVTATDDLGRSGAAGITVRALWPAEVPGIPRAQLCGSNPAADAGSGD